MGLGIEFNFFLIYFVFWFKFSNITFFKKIKMLTWHIKMLNNILITTLVSRQLITCFVSHVSFFC